MGGSVAIVKTVTKCQGVSKRAVFHNIVIIIEIQKLSSLSYFTRNMNSKRRCGRAGEGIHRLQFLTMSSMLKVLRITFLIVGREICSRKFSMIDEILFFVFQKLALEAN